MVITVFFLNISEIEGDEFFVLYGRVMFLELLEVVGEVGGKVDGGVDRFWD